MKTHTLKTDPETFDAVWRGVKTFEIRYDDRGFAVGAKLELRETTNTGASISRGAELRYTNRIIVKTISHILEGYGLTHGWKCLSFAPEPIDMALYCPRCHAQHVDAVELPTENAMHEAWPNPPHKSHLCRHCKLIWRPADYPTNGVQAVKTRGEKDTWPPVDENVSAR